MDKIRHLPRQPRDRDENGKCDDGARRQPATPLKRGALHGGGWVYRDNTEEVEFWEAV